MRASSYFYSKLLWRLAQELGAHILYNRSPEDDLRLHAGSIRRDGPTRLTKKGLPQCATASVTVAMYTSTFTFAAKPFDEAFHELDRAIAQAAQSIPGYIGEETWENPALGQVSNVYYWDNLDALHTLMQHPTHLAAKAQYAKWLLGYQVVIAQVIGHYRSGADTGEHGEGGIPHPLQGRPRMSWPAAIAATQERT